MRWNPTSHITTSYNAKCRAYRDAKEATVLLSSATCGRETGYIDQIYYEKRSDLCMITLAMSAFLARSSDAFPFFVKSVVYSAAKLLI